MPEGRFKFWMKLEFKIEPDVVYSPIVFFLETTNRLDPEMAKSEPARASPGRGAVASEPGPSAINAALTVAPPVVYSPIVPEFWFTTKMSDPDTAMPNGAPTPEIRDALTVAPENA